MSASKLCRENTFYIYRENTYILPSGKKERRRSAYVSVPKLYRENIFYITLEVYRENMFYIKPT